MVRFPPFWVSVVVSFFFGGFFPLSTPVFITICGDYARDLIALWIAAQLLGSCARLITIVFGMFYVYSIGMNFEMSPPLMLLFMANRYHKQNNRIPIDSSRAPN